jgi:RNA-binding protein
MHINVGKKGLTKNLINEINFQLKKQGVVKVRVLRSFRALEGKDKREFVEELASKVNGKLVDFRGFVLTFEKYRED